jgi:ABC-type ATPase involved in cell division
MKSTSAPIIEIRNLMLTTTERPGHDDPCRLVVNPGDWIAVLSDKPAACRHLFRVLATLERPIEGEYLFNGKPVELINYRDCLAIKRRIGYVAADTALISNRTLRENLLLTRFYYENDLTIDIDETVRGLCRSAGLTGKLEHRPSALSGVELLKAIAIREIAKAPLVMLIEQPEHFMQMTPDDGMFQHLKQMVQSGTAVVFHSNNNAMTGLANRRLALADGTIHTISV